MDMKASREFGARVTQVRTDAKLNKQEFARMLTVSPAYVTYLESGEKAGEPLNPTETLLFMIAHKFGVNMEWLRTGKGSMRLGLRAKVTARLGRLSDSQIKEVSKFIDTLENRGSEEPPNPRRHASSGGPEIDSGNNIFT